MFLEEIFCFKPNSIVRSSKWIVIVHRILVERTNYRNHVTSFCIRFTKTYRSTSVYVLICRHRQASQRTLVFIQLFFSSSSSSFPSSKTEYMIHFRKISFSIHSTRLPQFHQTKLKRTEKRRNVWENRREKVHVDIAYIHELSMDTHYYCKICPLPFTIQYLCECVFDARLCVYVCLTSGTVEWCALTAAAAAYI